MGTVTYEVTYRLKGDNGFCDSAIVVVNETDSHEHVRAVIAHNRMVTIDKIVNFHPVCLGANSFWNIG
jgi:hypothetical protein